MSQFEQGSRLDAMRRQGSALGPSTTNTRVGVNQSIQVVGQETLPPVVAGGSIAESLMQALGVAGNLAAGIGNTLDRQTAKIERKNAENKAYDIGQASRDYRTHAIEFQAKIESGEIKLPDGVDPTPENVTDFASQLVENRIDDPSINEPYKEEYRTLIPHVASMFQRKLTQERAQAKEALAQTLADGVAGSQTAGEMSKFMAVAQKDLNLTSVEAAEKTILPTMRAAANSGDRVRFEAAKTALGGMFQNEQKMGELALQQNERTNQRMQQQAIGDRYGQMWAEEKPVESIRSQYDADLKAGRIGGAFADSLLGDIQRAEARQAAVILKTETENARKVNEQAWQDMVDQAGDGGLLALIPKDGFKATLPDKTEQKVSYNEAIDMATDSAFARIERMYQGRPQEAISMQADWAARNGVEPVTWKRVLEAGAMQSTQSSLAQDKNAPQELPPMAESGFTLYRTLRAQQPQLLEKLLPGGKVRDFYETAETLMQDKAIGSTSPDAVRTALLNSAIQINNPNRSTLDGIQRDSLETAVKGMMSEGSLWWAKTANNGGEIAAEVSAKAMPKIRRGIPADEAVRQASEEVKNGRVIINNWAVPATDIGNLPGEIRDNISNVASTIIDDWISRNPDSGYSKESLTLKPIRDTGFWAIADGTNGLVIDPSAVFSPRELKARHDELVKAGFDKDTAKVLADWKARQEEALRAANRTPAERAMDNFERRGGRAGQRVY